MTKGQRLVTNTSRSCTREDVDLQLVLKTSLFYTPMHACIYMDLELEGGSFGGWMIAYAATGATGWAWPGTGGMKMGR